MEYSLLWDKYGNNLLRGNYRKKLNLRRSLNSIIMSQTWKTVHVLLGVIQYSGEKHGVQGIDVMAAWLHRESENKIYRGQRNQHGIQYRTAD